MSPDGKRLITLTWNVNHAILWNMKTRKKIGELLLEKSHDSARLCPAVFSADGSLIATGGSDKVRIWDAYTGVLREELGADSYKCTHLVFALDDTIVVQVSTPTGLVSWDVGPTEEKYKIGRFRSDWYWETDQHSSEIVVLVTTPDRRSVVTYAEDLTIRIWDVKTMRIKQSPILTPKPLRSVAVSKDGTKLIGGCVKGGLIIWNAHTSEQVCVLDTGTGDIRAIAVSPDGRLIATGCPNLHLWDIETGTLAHSALDEGSKMQGPILFDRLGTRLVTASSSQAKVWKLRRDADSGILQVAETVLRGHTQWIRDACISPNGSSVVTGSHDGTARVWDLDNTDSDVAVEESERVHDTVELMEVSADGQRLMTVGGDGSMQLWEMKTGRRLGSVVSCPEGSATGLRASFKTTYLWATGYRSGKIYLWRHGVDKHTMENTVFSGFGPIGTLQISAEDTLLACASSCHVQIWDVGTKRCIASFDRGGPVKVVAFSRDGVYIASAHTERTPFTVTTTIQIHEIVTERLISQIPLRSEIDFLVFSPDGSILASSYSSDLQLYDVYDNLRRYASITPSPKLMDCFDRPPAFSKDGNYLYFGRFVFKTAEIPKTMSLVTRQPPLALEGRRLGPLSPLYVAGQEGVIYSIHHENPVLLVPKDINASDGSWAASGNLLAFGSGDGRVFIIRFPEESLW